MSDSKMRFCPILPHIFWNFFSIFPSLSQNGGCWQLDLVYVSPAALHKRRRNPVMISYRMIPRLSAINPVNFAKEWVGISSVTVGGLGVLLGVNSSSDELLSHPGISSSDSTVPSEQLLSDWMSFSSEICLLFCLNSFRFCLCCSEQSVPSILLNWGYLRCPIKNSRSSCRNCGRVDASKISTLEGDKSQSVFSEFLN